jgi:hypothetical protein
LAGAEDDEEDPRGAEKAEAEAEASYIGKSLRLGMKEDEGQSFFIFL